MLMPQMTDGDRITITGMVPRGKFRQLLIRLKILTIFLKIKSTIKLMASMTSHWKWT